MFSPDWTLAQTLAWICFRTEVAVAEVDFMDAAAAVKVHKNYLASKGTGLDTLKPIGRGIMQSGLFPTGTIIDDLMRATWSGDITIRDELNAIISPKLLRNFVPRYVPDTMENLKTGKRFGDTIYFDQSDVRRVWPGEEVPALSQPPASSAASMRQTIDDEIRRAIREEYDAAAAEGNKPPNVNEARRAVYNTLKAHGKQAAHKRIEQLLDEQEFKDRRLNQGQRPK